MKKLWYVFVLSLLMSTFVFGQQRFVFDNYDMLPADNPLYGDSIFFVNGDNSTRSGIDITQETSNVFEGTGAIRLDYRVERSEGYGGFTKVEMWNPDSGSVWDFSPFDTLSLMYYVDSASSDPGHIHLRIQFYDVSDAPLNTYDAGNTELWYSFNYVLDDAPGWNELKLPLEDVGPDAFNGSNGFYLTGWAGISGNSTLDLDQIKGIGFEFSIDGINTFTVDSGNIIFDYLTFIPGDFSLILFNGKSLGSAVTDNWAWGGGINIVEGAGQTPETNAMLWSQGADWAGFGFTFDPKNMKFVWETDSVQFWMKAPTGTGTLRVSFEDEDVTKMYTEIEEPQEGYGDTWRLIKVALKDINTFDGSSEDPNFDTTKVTVFHIYAPGTGAVGRQIYFDDIWTGTPEIDVIPPEKPAPPFVLANAAYVNEISWLDDLTEEGETYTVYYSKTPFTSKDDPGVEVVDLGYGIAEGTQNVSHLLYSPVADSTVSLYYGLSVTDAFGNESEIGVTESPVTNTAKGIATVSMDVPQNFAPDGDLSEWASVKSFDFSVSGGSHIVTNTAIDNDDDLSGKLYLAVDNDYLYFAWEMTDDVVDTTATNTWEKDSPDLFIGLYDWHGKPHSGYGTGAEPDYHFRFLPTFVMIDNIGGHNIIPVGSPDYHWEQKLFPPGYVVEGKISLADLAAVQGDDLFVPEEGMRVPFDVAINDADGGGVREGIMTWSPNNEDNSWQSPANWMYTWVGNRALLSTEDAPVAQKYELEQNYPNPFNPTTTINYSLEKPGKVSLIIYNALGQQVATVVDGYKNAGRHTITFDASNLATGIYFYHIKSGDFSAVKKMLLVK
ncbi:MAG: hypothetical protein Kow00108_15190 [Calditrichia bacterium]